MKIFNLSYVDWTVGKFYRIIIFNMKRQFTANYKKTGSWYSAWVEEIPGVNTQGETLAKAKENLKDALMLTLETNRLLNAPKRGQKIIKEDLILTMS